MAADRVPRDEENGAASWCCCWPMYNLFTTNGITFNSGISSQREMDCCVFGLTKPWLGQNRPDQAIQLDSFSLHHMDRSMATTDEIKGDKKKKDFPPKKGSIPGTC